MQMNAMCYTIWLALSNRVSHCFVELVLFGSWPFIFAPPLVVLSLEIISKPLLGEHLAVPMVSRLQWLLLLESTMWTLSWPGSSSIPFGPWLLVLVSGGRDTSVEHALVLLLPKLFVLSFFETLRTEQTTLFWLIPFQNSTPKTGVVYYDVLRVRGSSRTPSLHQHEHATQTSIIIKTKLPR